EGIEKQISAAVNPHPNPLPEREGKRQQEVDGAKEEASGKQEADSANAQLPPASRVLPPVSSHLPSASCLLPSALTPLDDWLWQTEDAAALLIKQFGVHSLDGYGLTGKSEAVRAAGACLRYAQETQRAAAAHISDILYFEPQDHLVLDQITVRNLELVEAMGAGASRS